MNEELLMARWPSLVKAGMIGFKSITKRGRPRQFSDEQAKERQRERSREWKRKQRATA